MRWITQKREDQKEKVAKKKQKKVDNPEKNNRTSLQKKHYEVDNPEKKRPIGKNAKKTTTTKNIL